MSLVNKGDMAGEVVKKATTELTKSKPMGAVGLGGMSRTPGVRMGDDASPCELSGYVTDYQGTKGPSQNLTETLT